MAGASELKKLQYKIHKCSGYLSNYTPEKIMVDNPAEQSSRWSTITNTPPQFLTLKLEKPAIVKTITFGKYNKAHVCNLKKFSVVGGMQDDNFTELLNGGLENNNLQETFPLRHTTREGRPFPVQYISILPQQAWGPSFNYCVWYLEVHGVNHMATVRGALYRHNLRAEEETIRVCLKHLRQQRYTEAFAALQRETGVRLEAPQLSNLYRLLVEEGNFTGAEEMLAEAKKDGMFNLYVSQQPYTAAWSNVTPCSPDLAERLADCEESISPTHSPPPLVRERSPTPDGASSIPPRPGRRGGHQMCMDSDNNTMYLFGGWDGENDLSDLWSYYVPTDKWTLICRNSELVGGPSPRSCHKMVLDSDRRQIFTLGRYLDVKHRSSDNIKSDLYVFDITSSCWLQVCDDTGTRGGPRLMFDHQMCVDSERHIIYVFGGKILPKSGQAEDAVPQYSGLYSYHISEDRWRLLLADTASAPTSSCPTILSRVSHSMLFHPITRILYVFGGQRNKEHLADLLEVRVGSIGDCGDCRQGGEVFVRALCTAAPPRRAPPPGFTQRATIDHHLNEIYVLSGLSKEKDKRVSNSLWIFSLARLQWSCVYKNDNQGLHYWSKMHAVEPCPRFAHQLVYDPQGKVHYLFGGNPGRAAQPSLRLDDFWALRLSRLSSGAAWRKARLRLRKLRFEELVATGNTSEALTYLQNFLHRATDHTDSEQARQFQLLATMLFSEKQHLLSFNPPLEPSVSVDHTMETDCAALRPDPELHEDLQSKRQEVDYTDRFSSKPYQDAEQQALFAAVLGMESPDGIDGEIDTSRSGVALQGNSPETLIGETSDDFLIKLAEEEAIEQQKWNNLEVHYRRCELFQHLCEYFPHHMVQPKKNLTDYITM